MRFIFKTDYSQDLRLAKHGGHVFWYSALMVALCTAPVWLEEYWLAQLTYVLIYGVVGLGLMLLAGFTGLFSLGHAAFLGVGAYTQAVLTQMGWPFPVALAMAGLLSAAVGVVVGLPALRVKGIYLGIATLSFGFIVEEVFARWDSVTGGNTGKTSRIIQSGLIPDFWKPSSTFKRFEIFLILASEEVAISSARSVSTSRSISIVRKSSRTASAPIKARKSSPYSSVLAMKSSSDMI
jgi:branched-chain amino acid transport system permease protein